jgi:15-cis-phytoene synthase
MLYKHYQNAFVILDDYYKKWQYAYKHQNLDDEVFGEYVELFQKFGISFDYSQSFFDSMKMDCSFDRYLTYQQLDEYMYGSAAVI